MGLFYPEDAINNRYLAPFDDIEIRENDNRPNEGRWRFVSTPEDEWRPFGTFVSMDNDRAISVVHRTAPGHYAQAHKGAEKWIRAKKMILPQSVRDLSLHR